ncbi:MAG: ribosomal protection-like ABC-F family protein [Methyloligellaceae bacterium]
MLHINDLTYRIEGRTLLDQASAGLPDRARVGLVGRNGAGKSTLLHLITGTLAPDEGSIQRPSRARIGAVAQEAPGGPESLLETVLAADRERSDLLAESETATEPERIAEIQLRLNDIEAHSAPARAARILAGLGFDDATQGRPCAELSGGWRMRVALAALLFAAPDLLLLDEPTNYLDVEGTLWLENFLSAYPHMILIASHDRDLLNGSVTHILHLTGGKLSLYTGGFDAFEDTRREQQRLQLKLRKRQDDERRRLQAFVDRFRYKATKARQAQSRVKMLERMQPIVAQVEGRVAPFHFADPEKQLGDPLLRLEDASVGYEPGRPVLRDLSLRIDTDDRIGLLGQNGNGKSTFAKLLAGQLQPQAGHMRASKKLIAGYFAQHQLDELNPDGSPYDHIAPLMEDATEAQKRARLGQLGFSAATADTKAKNLSGGEKARLLFALATFDRPHLLILDEPTNHLDVDSREALIHALNAYDGAVILISHDRHLLETCADRLWRVAGGTVAPYEGDMESYRADCLAERSGRAKAAVGSPNGSAGGRGNRKDARRQAAEARAALAPLRRHVKETEARIGALTEKLDRIDTELGDTGLYDRDPDRAQRLVRERGALARELEEAEAAWLAASEALEAAGEAEPTA